MYRRRDPGATRQRILVAARREFVRKGLAGARVDEIARRSRISKRMLYHHFGNKADLYAAVLQTILVDLVRALPVLPPDDPIRAVRVAADFYFDYCATHPDYVALMLWEAVSGWKTAKRIVPPDLEPWPPAVVSVVRRGIDTGVFRQSTDPMLAVTAAASQILFYFPLMARHSDARPGVLGLKTARAGLTDLILNALLA